VCGKHIPFHRNNTNGGKALFKRERNRGKNIAIIMMNKFIVEKLPKVIRIEPSSICNLKCYHCPTGTNPPNVSRGIMSMDLFKKVFEEILTAGNVNTVVLYHGGEPFLNNNLFRMITILKEAGIKFVKTVTNGMLISKSNLGKLIESGLDCIEFSVDGLSPQENNEIRMGGSYYKVLDTIKELILLKEKKESARPEIFIANTQIPTEEIIKNQVLISPPEYIVNDLIEFKHKFEFKCTYMIKWPGFNCGSQYKVLKPTQSVQIPPVSECNHIIETISIRSNGDVVPCCYDISSQYVIGNILKQTFKEIWNNDKYLTLRKSISERNYLPLCENCPVIRPSGCICRV
jgi:radical SAM protein with 4Fe4S-binding SPASM domain